MQKHQVITTYQLLLRMVIKCYTAYIYTFYQILNAYIMQKHQLVTTTYQVLLRVISFIVPNKGIKPLKYFVLEIFLSNKGIKPLKYFVLEIFLSNKGIKPLS